MSTLLALASRVLSNVSSNSATTALGSRLGVVTIVGGIALSQQLSSPPGTCVAGWGLSACALRTHARGWVARAIGAAGVRRGHCERTTGALRPHTERAGVPLIAACADDWDGRMRHARANAQAMGLGIPGGGRAA